MNIQIAIDGPAGAGKSSAAKGVAARLGITYLDTGAMYRAVALKALRRGIPLLDEPAVVAMLETTSIDVIYKDGAQHVLLDGEDVSAAIRENHVSPAASAVSSLKLVREKLVSMQQQIAAGKPVVMDGRDIGTVVLPDAPYKFYITASSLRRAQRRSAELREKGLDSGSLEELQKEIEQRDYNDSHRENSPLRQAEDAVLIDTSDMTLEEVIDRMLEKISGGRK
jgi:cytidylate kinase